MSEPLHIVCPNCATTNRVPEDRLAQHPNCGKCKSGLFTGQPVELTEETFGRHVRNNGIPTLVDFWASWCGPCKMMGPVFAQAAAQLEPRARLAKVNTETQQALAARHRVQSIPTLILFRNGKEVERQAGALPLDSLLQWVRSRI